MNDNKKMTMIILALVLVIAVVASGTLAYWQWMTSTEQETLVNVSLTDDAKMNIDFPKEEITHMYPTSDCETNGTSSWVTEITVDNGTGVLLSPKFKLKVKIEDKDGNIITNTVSKIDGVYANAQPNRYYIKYAVTEEDGVCSQPLYAGRFDQNTQTVNGNTDWYDSGYITTFDDETGFPVVSGREDSGVSFFASPNTQTKQRFKVWVWLDKDYTSITVGNDSTLDPMQDAKVTVSWSENSELEQVQLNDAYAVYSEDDNSLRFYRSNTPITEGSTYNGRAVTFVYTGFENSTDVPWSGTVTKEYPPYSALPDGTDCMGGDSCSFSFTLSQEVQTVVFEDYIYPVSTASWFSGFFDVTTIDLTKLDISNTTNMSGMFRGTFGGLTIDLSHFDTSNVTNMSNMFEYSSTTPVGIEIWNTSNVTNMSYMFVDNYVSLNLTGWNVCNVIDYDMFAPASFDNFVSPYFGDSTKCNGGNPA